MATDLTQGYLSNILRRGARHYDHSTLRTSTRISETFAQTLLLTPPGEATLSSSFPDISPGLELAQQDFAADKREQPVDSYDRSAHQHDKAWPTSNQIHSPVESTTSAGEMVSPAHSPQPHRTEEGQAPVLALASDSGVENLRTSAGQLRGMNETGAAVSKTQVLESFMTGVLHRGAGSFAKQNDAQRKHVPATTNSALSKSTDETFVIADLQEKQDVFSEQEQSSGNNNASLSQTLETQAQYLQLSQGVLSTSELSRSTTPVSFTPELFVQSSLTHSDEGSVLETIPAKPVSSQSTIETPGQEELTVKDAFPFQPLTGATKKHSRLTERFGPSTRINGKASIASEKRELLPSPTSSQELARSPDKNRAEPDLNKVEPGKQVTVIRDEQRFDSADVSSAQNNVIRVPRLRLSARLRASLGERAGGAVRESAVPVDAVKNAEAGNNQSIVSTLSEGSAVYNSQAALATVPAPKEERPPARKTPPAQLNQPRLRETLSKQDFSSSQDNVSRLSIKRVDVRIINQNQTVLPKREPRVRPGDAQQNSGKNLDRHYLGRYQLNF